MIKADLIKEISPGVGIKVYTVDTGYWTIPLSMLHPATLAKLDLTAAPVTAPVTAPTPPPEPQRDEQARLLQAERQKLREAQIAADNALAAAQLREQAAATAQRSAKAVNPAMDAFKRQLAMQPKPDPQPAGGTSYDSEIAEQMRLDRLMRAAAQARKEGRPMYVSPADAAAIGR